ncbi:MAG: hypothetical protein MR666_05695, partial [Dialister sp.]|nr:hypothetical protein [Dialister sp.]
FVIISMRKVLSLFYFCTEIITFPLKGRLSSFIVSGKFPYRVKFYTKFEICILDIEKGLSVYPSGYTAKPFR